MKNRLLSVVMLVLGGCNAWQKQRSKSTSHFLLWGCHLSSMNWGISNHPKMSRRKLDNQEVGAVWFTKSHLVFFKNRISKKQEWNLTPLSCYIKSNHLIHHQEDIKLAGPLELPSDMLTRVLSRGCDSPMRYLETLKQDSAFRDFEALRPPSQIDNETKQVMAQASNKNTCRNRNSKQNLYIYNIYCIYIYYVYF